MTRPNDSIAAGFAALEATLQRQLDEYRSLRVLIERRREALRGADAVALQAVIEAERQALVRISDLDRARTEAANGLGRRLTVTPVTISALAVRAPEPARTAIETVAAALREEIEQCRRASSVVRAAADALAQHVSGILQTVQHAFAGTSTYGRAGRLASVGPIRSIDLRS
ncbi:MAG: flagellar protein FlgN [Phycisphaerae bacterium]|nr:flagellar protein FlgN [Phycisphaerae bacterium]